jgi:hypothetical protein
MLEKSLSRRSGLADYLLLLRAHLTFICFIWLSPPLAQLTLLPLLGETAWPDDSPVR